VLVALAVGAAPWVEPASVRADGPVVGDFAGVYRLSEATKTKAAIREEIDASTEGMSLLRGIARDRLYETTEPLSVLVIGSVGDRLSVGYLGEKAVVSSADGKPIKWANRLGDKVSVSQSFEGGRIVQVYKGAMNGRRRSVYSLSADRSRITISTVVTVDIVPDPVEFRLTYVRK